MAPDLFTDDGFDPVRDHIDDLLRRNVAEVGPREIDDDGEVGDLIESPILTDWLMLTSWVDRDGENYYVRVGSRHLSAHARLGLLAMFRDG